jgi:acyl-CoA dehydrogenase
MARVDLAATPARLLVDATDTADALSAARAWGNTLLAAEAVGVAARALDLAVGYARQREQFGRPIGGFQAVAHPLADAYVAVELARSLAYRAGWLIAAKDDTPGRDAAVAEAVIAARSAAVLACETAVQTTGGLGVTWEYPLHRWLRRALWLQSFADLGPDPHDVLAAHLLDEADPADPTGSGAHPAPAERR